MCRDNHLPLRVFNLNNAGRSAAHRARRGRRHAGHQRSYAEEDDTMLDDIKKDADERMSKCVEAFARRAEEAAHRPRASPA